MTIRLTAFAIKKCRRNEQDSEIMTSPHLDSLCKQYVQLLLKWNAKINLTAITNEDEIKIKHLEDAFCVLPYVKNAKSLIDLGTGGGIPGLPIKLALLELSVVLLDATQKKITFLQNVIATLQLDKINAVCGRAEDKRLQLECGKFDIVISRATWALKAYLPLAGEYLAPGGKIIAMKSAKADEELSDASEVLEALSLKLVERKDYTLSNADHRTLFLFQKNNHS